MSKTFTTTVYCSNCSDFLFNVRRKLWIKRADNVIFAARWVLYPINLALITALLLYVVAFLVNDYRFIVHQFTWDTESLMVSLLGFVDASMVANLIVMVVQGGHRIFIHRFETSEERPQWLDHIDSSQHSRNYSDSNTQRFCSY